MVKCPNCGTKVSTVSREWNYSRYHVKRYDCPNCKTWIREYYYKDECVFVLAPIKGKGIRKINKT